MATSPTYCTMISRTLALKRIKNGKTQRELCIKDRYAGSSTVKSGLKNNNRDTTTASKLKINARKVKNNKPESPLRGLSEERRKARKIMADASRTAPQRIIRVAKAWRLAKGGPAKKRLTREKNLCIHREIIPRLPS